MSVTIAKRGEANLVSHIPAKSSHGAANSRVMRPKARPRGSERPTTTRDKAAAKIPYIGTCTWVSWISRSVSTAWTSGRANSALDNRGSTAFGASGRLGLHLPPPPVGAATPFRLEPGQQPTIPDPHHAGHA